MIKTLLIGRSDNYDVFQESQFLCKCLVFEIKRKNRERIHTIISPKFGLAPKFGFFTIII